MDKEFEEWYRETYDDIFVDEKGGLAYSLEMRKCWNASKQYWLDKAVEVVNKKGTCFDGYSIDSRAKEIAEAIKELKK